MKIDPEELAKRFHETYERLAPSFGYETRKESAKPWADVPENNKRLMIAVCGEIISWSAIPLVRARQRIRLARALSETRRAEAEAVISALNKLDSEVFEMIPEEMKLQP